MGAEPYDHTVPYQSDLNAALAALRREVFEGGRYEGAERNPPTPEAALEGAGAEGTRSILDITGVSEEPEVCRVTPCSPEELREWFGTERPTAEMLDDAEDFWEEIPRGSARCLTLYEGGEPVSLFFAGYSFD